MATAASLPARTLVLADVIPGARVRDAILVTGAALFTALLAQVSIPVAGSPVPITGQTLAVVLTAAALGPARGFADRHPRQRKHAARARLRQGHTRR